MNTLNYTLSDAVTMLRRNLVHIRRYPVMIIVVTAMPIILLLMFVYVLGGTLGAGLGTGLNVPDGRGEYLKYVVPGILVLGIGVGMQGTAIVVAKDMTEGIIARFRTMAISRAAVMAGHVLGSLIQTLLGLAIVMVVALLLGFRPTTGPLEWLAALGVVALITFALTWLSVAFGMFAKTVEGASNLPLPFSLLPFFGSGFVPTSSMPDVVRWFAEFQPFTPFTETLRSLLVGTPMGNSWMLTLIWCVGIALIGYFWSLSLYNRRSTR